MKNMNNMGKYKKYIKHYNSDWEKQPEFKGWLTAAGNDAALCKLCNRELRAHKADLLRHKATTKHLEKENSLKHQSVLGKFITSGNSCDSAISPPKEADSVRKELKKLKHEASLTEDARKICAAALKELKEGDRQRQELMRDLQRLEKEKDQNEERFREALRTEIQKTEFEKCAKIAEHEKYVQSYSLHSLRLYLEQLSWEFRRGSHNPTKDQMIADLEVEKETAAFTGVSFRCIEWLWYLRCSSYGPAVRLHKLASQKFDNLSDFVEVLSPVFDEACGNIQHSLDPIEPDEIKRGLKLYGLNSPRMDNAIDTLYGFKHLSPPKKRTLSNHSKSKHMKIDLSNSNTHSSSTSEESKSRKRPTLDRSKVYSSSSDEDPSSASS